MENRDPRRWWTLAAMSATMILIGLDLTVLATALPTLARELHASTSDLQWFTNAYSLAIAALLLPAGLISDRLGPKPVMFVALVLFGLSSRACGLSTSPGWLIAARTLLGVAAALVTPVSMSLLTIVFPPAEREKAVGIWVTANSLGMPIGPLLGGWLLDHWHWSWVFYINVPVAAIAAVATLALVPRTPGHRGQHADIVGIVLSSAGLTALTYGLIHAGEKGWDSKTALGWIAAGVVGMLAFAVWITRVRRPLVDPRLFRSRAFSFSTVVLGLAGLAMMGVFFVLPQYFQSARGKTAFQSGYLLMPAIIGIIVSRVLMPVTSRLGRRASLLIACLLLTGALAWGTQWHVDTAWWQIVAWQLLAGIGFGIMLPLLIAVALEDMDQTSSGIASATLQAVRQVGSTMGVAILGSVVSTVYKDRLVLPPKLPGALADKAKDSVQAAIAIADQLHLPAMRDSARAAFTAGGAWALGVTAVIFAILALVTWPLMPRARRGE